MKVICRESHWYVERKKYCKDVKGNRESDKSESEAERGRRCGPKMWKRVERGKDKSGGGSGG